MKINLCVCLARMPMKATGFAVGVSRDPELLRRALLLHLLSLSLTRPSLSMSYLKVNKLAGDMSLLHQNFSFSVCAASNSN